MRPAGLRRRKPPRKADFEPLRVSAHVAACGRRRDLDAPARAEGRDARSKDRAHQVDLAVYRGGPIVEVESRARQHDAVIGRKAGRIRQIRALVGRKRKFAYRVLFDRLEDRGVGFARH